MASVEEEEMPESLRLDLYCHAMNIMDDPHNIPNKA